MTGNELEQILEILHERDQYLKDCLILSLMDKDGAITTYLKALQEIDTHIRSTKEPVPHIVETLKRTLDWHK